jgi:hypothetical protein
MPSISRAAGRDADVAAGRDSRLHATGLTIGPPEGLIFGGPSGCGGAATALTGKAAVQAISPRLSNSALPRHHATGEGGRRSADACLSA